MSSFWIEAIGYVATGLILIAMLMTSMVRLRIINMIGSFIFAVYAFLIHSYPTMVLNGVLVLINVYQILRLVKGKKPYDLIRASVSDGYVAYLRDTSYEDICHWFPEFPTLKEKADLAFIVCCDKSPAGLFLGKLTAPGEIEVIIDYALPAYRDTTVSKFLYEKLIEDEYKKLVFDQNAPGHTGYLLNMGYQQNSDGAYVLELGSKETA